MTRHEHESRLMANLPMCSDDELRVIDRFVQRIHNARREYGPLRIKRDTRDYRHEAAAEAFDACFYLCLEDVRRGAELQEPRFEAAARVREAIASQKHKGPA